MAALIHATELQDRVDHWMGGEQGGWFGSATGEMFRARRHPGDDRFGYLYSDIDFFMWSSEALASAARSLLDRGAVPFDEQELRKWNRWMKYGMGGFHTQSLRLETPDGLSINLVYKTVGNAPLRSPFAVLNTFDFSNVSHAYDLASRRWYDMADMYWKGHDPDQVKVFPDREQQWLHGQIGKHAGPRQARRYAVNMSRHWDMSRCKEPLVQAYRVVASFYLSREDDELQAYARVYLGLADLIEADDYEGILDIFKDVHPHSDILVIEGAM